MMHTIKEVIKKFVPKESLLLYHYLLSYISALLSGFPAKKMEVILVTGTKGKSTVSELIYTILKESGHKAALISTIKFALPEETIPNKLKMTMPGRGQIHRLLKKAYDQGAKYAVIEATSEGTKLYRHTFLFPDILVFTNLQKEHIESHGSFENYKKAKLLYAKEIQKQRGAIVANGDDKHADDFLAYATVKVPYKEKELENLSLTSSGISFEYKGSPVSLPLPGKFNAMNALAALKVANLLSIPDEEAVHAIQKTEKVRGRVEFVDAGQDFAAVVDYAHTPDSLEALYGAFPEQKKICILGNTGGGRDTWKRPLMGVIAENHCEVVILTNEDPYDEDPQKIIDEMSAEMKKEPVVIMDRREAINHALSIAQKDDVVLISGKGTDPYIMEARGKRTPWDDATVVREELAKILG
ncbi:MAG: Mur ligase family protein [Patescibacteria group bacterium UBA2103]